MHMYSHKQMNKCNDFLIKMKNLISPTSLMSHLAILRGTQTLM